MSKEGMNGNNFMGIFEDALTRVIKENSETPAIINPYRYKVLLEAKDLFDVLLKESWNDPCQIKFYPAFGAAAITAEVDDFEVTSCNADMFCKLMKSANTFSVTPLVSGRARVSFSFNHVLDHIR